VYLGQRTVKAHWRVVYALYKFSHNDILWLSLKNGHGISLVLVFPCYILMCIVFYLIYILIG